MSTEPKVGRRPAAQAWRMDPIPSHPAYKDEEGHIRVPVWLVKNGRHVADTEMVLLPSEAQLLVEHLTGALDGSRTVLEELFRGSPLAVSPGVLLVLKGSHIQS